ncbi:hypothetical protein NDR87_26760 [Nocardia sp. CDC159]|uniref:AMIN-like domain-containing protein n=1 Tax=Nocardia pulmonis TaxID=2951408 RepID=A0A9X2EB46_9NOCA|nr:MULTISPECIES: hypothetical protein [Nocardia]MCM6777094.1 hypothetical protein [Nocardia pulmonis]MCM6789979.1 hypothetical protein [Nocardia sp. CDC159]
MRNRLVLISIAGFALLTGCSNGSSQQPPGAEAGVTTEAKPTATTPVQGKPSTDARLTVADIRIGHHDGFDRVVYRLGGIGQPGWRVQYTDRAVQDGSGKPIEVAGRSILQVQILGSAYPWDSGVAEYAGSDPATDPSAPTIAGVYSTHVFEGTTQSFIGVNAERPAFSVTALTNPARLVVDVATR